MRIQLFIFLAFLFISGVNYSQLCTTPGQTPSTALPVCGSSAFAQYSIPRCKNNYLYVPGCTAGPANITDYDDRNPFWYRFTCSTSGTLGFIISPNAKDQDYDWQLFDITGHNPDDVYTDTSLVVTGNWPGDFGETGATLGVPLIACASALERFAEKPDLIEGHD